MDTTEMLDRIKEKDFKALFQLTEDYGWNLYSRLRKRFSDPELVNAAFNETISDFCSDLSGNDGKDAIESLLYAYAEKVCRRMEQAPKCSIAFSSPAAEFPNGFPNDAPDDFPNPAPAKKGKPEKRERRRGGFGFALCVLILLVGIAAALWVILGLLMDMQLIPYLDLGYSWFNMHVAPWFS